MKKHLKQIALISVLSCAILFFLYKPLDPQPQHIIKTTTVGVSGETHLSSEVPLTSTKVLTFFEPVQTPPDFYQTIVNNNLFRPLGWRPPRPREPYRLLGTLIPIDENTLPQAVLRNPVTRTTHIVRIGDALDTDTTVTDIQPKQVILEKAGLQRTLTLNLTPLIK